jgi:hypothetical protein
MRTELIITFSKMEAFSDLRTISVKWYVYVSFPLLWKIPEITNF